MYLFISGAREKRMPAAADLCKAAIFIGALSIAFGLLFSSSSRFESVAELQPLRAFHSIYVVFFVLIGTELGRLVLHSSVIRHVFCLAPVCACMFLVQRATFPASEHIQWPWRDEGNPWLQAFVWIRDNTPRSAVFALNPDHMTTAGEDNEGFRAVAERSMLADHIKDAGVVTMFPGLAKTWDREVSSTRQWNRFGPSDFQRLLHVYGVSWVVLERPVAGVA